MSPSLFRRIALILGLLVVIGGWKAVDYAANLRFPTTELTVDQINSTGTPLANTQSAFASAAKGETATLRVLFYGQSIIGSGWPDIAMARLQKTNPNIRFQWQNRAIGGFSAENLVRTTPGDLVDISPDLIVFHVYGDHRAYAKTIEEMLARTGADVILQTDHATELPEPRCPMGFRPYLGQPEGCKGWPILRQDKWSDYMSFHLIPSLAAKHGLAVAPVRTEWAKRLSAEQKQPSDVLSDTQHLNGDGEAWMADMFVAFLEAHTQGAVDTPRRQKIALPPANPDGSYTIETTADRIEAVSNVPLGPIAVSVDGTPTHKLSHCFAHSRASGSFPGHHWPAARRLKADTLLEPETWTATLRDFSSDYTEFDFTVSGSLTGPDGSGKASEDFRSNSQRVVIDAADWTPGLLHEVKGYKLADPLIVMWTSRFLCDDVTVVSDQGKEDPFFFTTLVTGLAAENGESDVSTVNFSLAPDMVQHVDSILMTATRY